MPTTVTHEEITDRVCKLAAEQAGMEQADISADTHLFNDLQFDSLDDVEFILTIEDEFGISIEDEQAGDVKTIGEVAAVLKSLLHVDS
jgi:acyl carrier protein